MKISVCMNTGRSDTPMLAYPNRHHFQFFMESLRKQTYCDFEVVIADILHGQRPNYFIDNPEDFRVIHVPVKPNVWSKRGLCGISTTKNTCLMYATGDVFVFVDDCISFKSDYLEKIAKDINSASAVTTRYEYRLGDELKTVDRRRADSQKLYGQIALSADNWLVLNGYDEMYDGSKGLEDCDLGRRIGQMGLKVKYQFDNIVTYQMHKELPTISYRNGVRCPQLWASLSYQRGLIRANTKPITEEEFRALFRCSGDEPGRICFKSKKPCPWVDNSGASRSAKNLELMNLYKHPSLLFDLSEQRKNPEEAVKYLESICQ